MKVSLISNWLWRPYFSPLEVRYETSLWLHRSEQLVRSPVKWISGSEMKWVSGFLMKWVSGSPVKWAPSSPVKWISSSPAKWVSRISNEVGIWISSVVCTSVSSEVDIALFSEWWRRFYCRCLTLGLSSLLWHSSDPISLKGTKRKVTLRERVKLCCFRGNKLFRHVHGCMLRNAAKFLVSCCNLNPDIRVLTSCRLCRNFTWKY
jgi:hypothetical protein